MGVVTAGTLAQPLIVPAVGRAVAISLVGAGKFPPSAFVAIDSGGDAPLVGKVLRVSGGTVLQVVQLGSAIVGQTILAGASAWITGSAVVTAGSQGPPGPSGKDGTAGAPGPTGPQGVPGSTSQTTGSITVPNVGAPVTVPVNNGSGFPNGSELIVSNGASAFSGSVTSGGTTTSLVLTCDQIILGSAGDTLLSGTPVAIYGGGGSSMVQVGPNVVLLLTPSSATGWGSSGDSGLQMLETNKRCNNFTIAMRGGFSGYTIKLYGSISGELTGKSNGDITLPVTSFFEIPVKQMGNLGGVESGVYLVQPLSSATDQASLYVAQMNIHAVRVVLVNKNGTPGGNVYVECTATSAS